MNLLTKFKKIPLLPLLIALAFLVIQPIPRALGQRDASKRSSDVEIPLLKQQEIAKQQPVPLEPGVKVPVSPRASPNATLAVKV